MADGVAAQQLGDRGEDEVRVALTRGNFVVRTMDRDGGEDLLVEVEGRSATATGAPPRMALIQVKSTSMKLGEHRASLSIEKERLLRWSAQQLPVIVVLMEESDLPRWFCSSVDDFLEEGQFGRDLETSTQKSFSVPLTLVENLAAWVRAVVVEFHATRVPDFGAMTPAQRRDHYEVFESSKVEWTPRIHLNQRVVLWRGPRRPAYFAAMVRQLLREARESLGSEFLPAMVYFHIYRSEVDRENNMAAARVYWFQKDHPRVHPDLASYTELEIKPSEENDEVRGIWEARTLTPSEFLDVVRPIVAGLDELALRILSVRGAEAWRPTDVAAYRALRESWTHRAGGAPVELRVVRSFIRDYVSTVHTHQTFALRKDEARAREGAAPLDDRTRARWIREEEDALAGYLGAVPHVVRASGFRLHNF